MLAGLQICHGFKEHFLINVRNESSSCCFHGKLVGFVCPKELVSSTSNMWHILLQSENVLVAQNSLQQLDFDGLL